METLWVWVHGEDVERFFPVEISKTDTVAYLKKAIKNKKSVKFRDVDACDLDLYSIPLPDVERQYELSQWSPRGETKLKPLLKLSSLIPEGDSREWLIIVSVPSLDSRASQPTVIAPDLTLNCWVRGEGINDIFQVKISSTERVSALREAIKSEKPVEFHDIDAHALLLHKVSLVIDDEERLFDDVLGPLTICTLGKPLFPIRRLSTIFTPRPPDDQLHLIIHAFMSVQCWIRGADPLSSFRVRLEICDTLGDLKNAIKAAQPDFHDLGADRLRVYKVPVDDEVLPEVLGSLGSGQVLVRNERLRKIFDDVPFARTPRVVVEPLERRIWKPAPATYRHIGNDDPITTARSAFLASATKASTAIPSTFRQRQTEGRPKAIPRGRPREYEDILPATLLHPAFGQFLDDCQTIAVTLEDTTFATSLAKAMSDLYESESKRVEEINKVFQDYNVHFTVTEVEKTGCAVDADISVNGHRYVIAEYKNETGSTAADPYFQGIGYYLESTRETALKFPRSPLPCFLLAIFGPYIVFAGAAWNLRPTVQILSTPVAFHSHSTVARHMAAFRKAARTLKQYYETVEATPLPTLGPVPRQVFPYPTNYKSLVDGTEKQFDYLMAPDEDKLVFYGVEDEGDDICIKFTQAYSREAHEYLASLGCAPALRGLEELDGVWYMVIMDMLSGFELLSYWPARLSSRVFEVMLEKLKEFHDAGFVHGDIRDANIMVSRTDEMRFMFIDFDWAGRVDEVRYPLNVNYTDIVRPAGARGGRNILAEHDLFMLEDIARSKSQPHN